MLTFNTNGMINQCFPFKDPFMEYIFKNVRPKHLIKLYRCSKFFYNKFRQNFIQHLEIIRHDEQEVFDFTKTAIHSCNPALSKLADFWIVDSFIYRVSPGVPFLPEFSNLTIKELKINDDIVWEEFETLTRPATIEKFKLHGIYPLRNSGIYAETLVEEIIARVPNATSIEVFDCFISPTTWSTLASMNHSKKLSKFILTQVYGNIDINLLTEYILKNASDDCCVYVDFYDAQETDERIQMLRNLKTQYNKQIAEALETMKKGTLKEQTPKP